MDGRTDGARTSAGDYGAPIAGEARRPGQAARRATIALGTEAFVLAIKGTPPTTIAYRDLSVVSIDHAVGLIAAGEGADAPRWLLERWGPALGPLLTGLRERRLRQRLSDGFVELPDEPPLEIVEYALPDALEQGVAHLVLHPWGLIVAPLDERHDWIRMRRAGIGAIDALPAVGGLRIHADDGAAVVEVLRLGAAAARHRASIDALRDSAAVDAGRIVSALAPDVAFVARDRAARALVDGRPVEPGALGDAWPAMEAAVLTQPVFAASYAALAARSPGPDGRWLALAPEWPGSAIPRAWFLVRLPGNLVALELVSAGAHATYCFRARPRAGHPGGETDPAAAAATVGTISEALVDARFLREPIALPDARLATPEFRRYRLALAALPSLAAARAAFVARLVHRYEATWSAALDDLVTWHDACRDDTAAWPGRREQEAAIDAADAGDGARGGAAGATAAAAGEPAGDMRPLPD